MNKKDFNVTPNILGRGESVAIHVNHSGSLKLINSSGKIISTGLVNSGRESFAIPENVMPGVYLLEFSSNGIKNRKKIVVTK